MSRVLWSSRAATTDRARGESGFRGRELAATPLRGVTRPPPIPTTPAQWRLTFFAPTDFSKIASIRPTPRLLCRRRQTVAPVASDAFTATAAALAGFTPSTTLTSPTAFRSRAIKFGIVIFFSSFFVFCFFFISYVMDYCAARNHPMTWVPEPGSNYTRFFLSIHNACPIVSHWNLITH